jgi:chorismate dehydratase
MTGLPFVFAAWMARQGVDLRDVPQRLEHAKQQGLEHVNDLIARYAVPRGWPAGIALQYLTVYLKYDIGERELRAIELFHDLAAKQGLIPSPPRRVELYSQRVEPQMNAASRG